MPFSGGLAMKLNLRKISGQTIVDISYYGMAAAGIVLIGGFLYLSNDYKPEAWHLWAGIGLFGVMSAMGFSVAVGRNRQQQEIASQLPRPLKHLAGEPIPRSFLTKGLIAHAVLIVVCIVVGVWTAL